METSHLIKFLRNFSEEKKEKIKNYIKFLEFEENKK